MPHCGDDGHPGEVPEIRHQKIGDALQGTGTRDRVDGNGDGEHNQNRHHNGRDALNAVLHPHIDDEHCGRAEEEKPEFGFSAARDEAAEVIVARERRDFSAAVGIEILGDPAADDRIIRDNQNRYDSVDPAAEAEHPVFAVVRKSADRALFGAPPEGALGDNHGIAEAQNQEQVNQ